MLNGQGWVIWCSRKGEANFNPPEVKVRKQAASEAIQTSWLLLPKVPGLQRRMGLLTVQLTTPAPPEGAWFYLTISHNNQSQEFNWSTLPYQVTPRGVTFLFASCFWQNNDRDGYYRAGLQELQALSNPQFKLLNGDQVYLDWPNDWDLGDEAIELFSKRYRQYWGDAFYRAALQTCPNFVVCDDHEYWNDYPEKQVHLPQTWDAKNRQKYGGGADELYKQFQRCLNPNQANWYTFTITPVSFFVTDTRSERQPCQGGSSHFMSDDQWTALESWQVALRGPGVLVLGQPLFQKDGDFRDHSLSNFGEDYARLWRVVERSLAGDNGQQIPHDILILSGDIHTGRYAEAHGPFSDAPYGVPEFIASPAAMIHPGSAKPEVPPEKITIRPNALGGESVWKIDPQNHLEIMTIQNNVGLIKIFPGTQVGGNPRVRFELELWRLPAKVIQVDWDEDAPPHGTGGPLKQLFTKELLLR
ncbi:MAG: alkaline phosphatase D family protein [Nitrospirales bacterium]